MACIWSLDYPVSYTRSCYTCVKNVFAPMHRHTRKLTKKQIELINTRKHDSQGVLPL